MAPCFQFTLFITILNLCMNNSEIVHCAKVASCKCVQNNACTINCIGEDFCSTSVTLTCKVNQACAINCVGISACGDAKINGAKATDVTILCDGKDACKGNDDIICGSGDCDIECIQKDGGDTCNKNIDIYSSNSRSLQCTGDCPANWPVSYSLAPTRYPTFTTTSNPTQRPTANPIHAPTFTPTRAPTQESTEISTVSPSTLNTQIPTIKTTYKPTKSPTVQPTKRGQILIANPEPTAATKPPSRGSKEVDEILSSIDTTQNDIKDVHVEPHTNTLFSWFTQSHVMFIVLVTVFVSFAVCIICVITRQQRMIRQLKAGGTQHRYTHEPASTHAIVQSNVPDSDPGEFVDGDEGAPGAGESIGTTYHSLKKVLRLDSEENNFDGMKNVEMLKLNGAQSTQGDIMAEDDSMSEDSMDGKDGFNHANEEYTKTETGPIAGDNVLYVKEESVSWISHVTEDDEVIGYDDDELLTKGQQTQNASNDYHKGECLL